MAQLDFRAQANVPGQKARHGRFGQPVALLHKLENPFTNSALTQVQDLIEPEDITLEKPFEILRRAGDAVKHEEFAHDRDIRSARELQLFKAIDGIEFSAKDFRERPHPRPARANQSAIDIEQNQPNHGKNYRSRTKT